MDFDENRRRNANMFGASKADKQSLMDARSGKAGYGRGIMKDKIAQAGGGAGYGNGINRNLVGGGAAYGNGINRNLVRGGAAYGNGINRNLIANSGFGTEQKRQREGAVIHNTDRGRVMAQKARNTGFDDMNGRFGQTLKRNSRDGNGQGVVFNDQSKFTFQEGFDFADDPKKPFDEPWTTHQLGGMFGV
jgi:hypothetical protein